MKLAAYFEYYRKLFKRQYVSFGTVLLPLNFSKMSKKGLTSGSDSVIEICFTLIACEILPYLALGIATENTQKKSDFQRKWLTKSFIEELF